MDRDIRDLLARASASFDTIVVDWLAEYDTALLQHAADRSTPDRARLLAMGALARLEAPDPQPGVGEDRRFRHEWRAWWRKPACWRDDIVWQNGATAVSIVCDAAASSFISPRRTLYTSERPHGTLARLRAALGPRADHHVPRLEDRLQQVPLVEPSFLATGWQLAALGEDRHAGRAVVRVRATRLDTTSRPALWDYVQEYDLLVDRERGVLLRYAGLVDGKEAGVMSVRSVRFDEPIPDDVFRYHPPKGTKVVWAESTMGRPPTDTG